MLRKVILVRHGESADKQAGQSDFDRALTVRGRSSVQRLGKYLGQENIFIDLLFSSPAVRAKQTTTIVAEEIGLTKIKYVVPLFNGTDSDYLDIVHQCVGTIMIVGHNPAISFVAGKLCNNYSISLMPGQAVIIEISEDDSKKSSGSLLKLVGPLHK